jgi:hypothetical protein
MAQETAVDSASRALSQGSLAVTSSGHPTCPTCATVLAEARRQEGSAQARYRRPIPGHRFSLVSFLPTVTLIGLTAALLASGAPARSPDVRLVVDRATGLTVAGAAALLGSALVLAVLTTPMQRGLVRLLEGYWGGSLIGSTLADVGIRLQRSRIEQLVRRVDREGDSTRIARAREVADEKLATYPATELLPTRLGNVLRAAEERAGQRYGLDTIAVWPRLYQKLSPTLTETIVDLRNQLDMSIRFCAALLVTSLIALPLVFEHGWWLLAPAVMVALGWVAYRAAIAAAIAFGRQLYVAFDLRRFHLLQELHIPLPVNPSEEIILNKSISTFFRYGWIDPDLRMPVERYEHPRVDEGQGTPLLSRT